MSRLAFFSPLPPAPSGIADYAADVVQILAAHHAVDVFHDQAAVDRDRMPRAAAIEPHSAFAARDAERPYDLTVHQLGNSPAHDFVYAAMARRPGLLLLHDLVLHHARARAFLESPEAQAYAREPGRDDRRREAEAVLGRYAEEVRYSYPAQADRLVAAQLGTVGHLLPYAYPLFRLPVSSSRVVAVHNEFMARAVRSAAPEAEVVRIPMPVERAPVHPGAVEALRARYGIDGGDFVVGTFGLVTREKRVETTARAVARAAATQPRIRLLVAGPVDDRDALESRLGALGVRGAVVTGRVPFPELAAHIEMADAVVHLRYPTARETSAALLRVLAQGRPTVMADLEHLADVPADAVLRADVADEEGEVTRAILRLAASAPLRARLGAAARDFVARAHAPSRCAEGYAKAVRLALAKPDPPPRGWPAHWTALAGRG